VTSPERQHKHLQTLLLTKNKDIGLKTLLQAVKYGKSDNLVAGEEGFDTFYQDFQHELDTIGKRPDLLIFNKNDFNAILGDDISQIPHHQITDYVKKAIAGIEVRSSAFLIDQYELQNVLKLHYKQKVKFLKIIQIYSHTLLGNLT